ncbi:MAG: TIR domain-containing protein [Candidatus Hermodarchaeota archaeon]
MPRCFVISPIREDRYDQIYNLIIKPAMEEYGIETFRETKLSNKVFDLIPTYDLCIIIHSKEHPLLYYQTAIAKCAGKPLIFLKAKGESLPFYLNNEYNVIYDLDNLEQENVEVVIKDIISRVNDIEINDWESLQPFSFEKVQKVKESIQKGKKKQCYIIGPITHEGSDMKEHIDSVFNYIIKPGLKKFDLDTYTIMDLKSNVASLGPGLLSERKLRLLSEKVLKVLSDQVYKAILTMDICIAILTFPDPNVFYELGIAHFESRPVIKLMEKETYKNYPFVLRKKKDLILYTYQYLSLKSVFYDKTYTNQIFDYIRTLEAADWKVPNFQFKDIVIENEFTKYIKKKISQTHREIKFDNLASKTGLKSQKVEELIEKMILRRDLNAEIIKNKIIFSPSAVRPISTIPTSKKILIFISYATMDADWYKIKEISTALTNYNEIEKVLYWEEDMKDNMYEYMDEKLGKCDVMLLFCSPNALKSKPVIKEWTAADSMEIPIIPIFFNPGHIPPLLKSRLGVQFIPFEFEKNVKKIYELIIKKSEQKTIDVWKD